MKGFQREKTRCQGLFEPRRRRARCAGAPHTPLHAASEREWLALGLPPATRAGPPLLPSRWPGWGGRECNLPVWRNPAALHKSWSLDVRKIAALEMSKTTTRTEPTFKEMAVEEVVVDTQSTGV